MLAAPTQYHSSSVMLGIKAVCQWTGNAVGAVFQPGNLAHQLAYTRKSWVKFRTCTARRSKKDKLA
jgi:hypothetical protein